MAARFHTDRALLRLVPVNAIVVDDLFAINEELGAIVGSQPEVVFAGFRYVESALIVNGEPLLSGYGSGQRL